MKNYAILVLLTLFTYSCNKSKKNQIEEKAQAIIVKDPSYCDNIESTTGVLVINMEEINEEDKIEILEKDSSIFKTLTATYEKEKLSYKCLNVNDNLYTILINDQIKYLPNDDRLINLQTWEEHLLKNVFSIGFDIQENPIRESVKGKPILLKKSNNYRIFPIEISEHWMKVKYQDFNNEEITVGWIKWRNEKCLFIEIFYFA